MFPFVLSSAVVAYLKQLRWIYFSFFRVAPWIKRRLRFPLQEIQSPNRQTEYYSTLGLCNTTEYTVSLYYSQHGLTLCFPALFEHARRLLRRTFFNSAFHA
jgi:hypothetical protein